MVAFYDGVMASVNKGGAIDVIGLDFCEVLDTMPHHSLLSTLERYRFEEWTVR